MWILPAGLNGWNDDAKDHTLNDFSLDDLGKEWIGCYGAEGIQTPHIDRLAATGMRFENAYCMPQCTPTRVTLLTGQYPFHHGWTNHWDVPRWGCGCHFDPQQNASFARLLRGAGYATVIAGKWQIDDFRVEPQALGEAGFDEWCVWTGGEGGHPESDERYWNPYVRVGPTSRSRQRPRAPTARRPVQRDPWEEHNLIGEDNAEAKQALERLMGVIASLPNTDAAPRYTPNPAQAWDRFEYTARQEPTPDR